MRDYTKIDKYLDRLINDIYPQPSDPGHTAWARENINRIVPLMPDVKSVLDVGCGDGFCQEIFQSLGIDYTGIALGVDVISAKSRGLTVYEGDFSFLSAPDKSFDLVYSRHSLEHSPIPLITLMEWHRITKKYLALVLPAPEYWKYSGRNHYYMLHQVQWENLFDVAGFKVIYSGIKEQPMGEDGKSISLIEYWYVLETK